MDIRIVFFDIDGTLVNENNIIPEDSVHAIRLLQSKGIQTVICTGRAPLHMKHIADRLNINSYICFNGGYAVINGKVIFESYIRTSILRNLQWDSIEMGNPLVYLSDKGCFSQYSENERVKSSFDFLHVDLPVNEPFEIENEKVFQLYLYCDSKEQKIIEEKYPNLKLTRWHRYAVDVNDSTCNKSQGVKEILKFLNLKPSQAVAFGDNYNDKEMLSYVGLGIAMGNSPEEIKNYARFTTKHINDGGIVHGLRYSGLL